MSIYLIVLINSQIRENIIVPWISALIIDIFSIILGSGIYITGQFTISFSYEELIKGVNIYNRNKIKKYQ